MCFNICFNVYFKQSKSSFEGIYARLFPFHQLFINFSCGTFFFPT